MNPLQIRLPPDFQCLGSARNFAEDIHEIFSAQALLQSLDVNETALLCHFMVCYSAPRGSELLSEGEPGDFMIFLLTGQAEMVLVDDFGDRHRVGLIEPGAPVGHMSMIAGQPRSTSCVALDPVDFVVLPKQAFNDILVTLPRLGNKLMLVMLHGLSERLQAAQKQLVYALPPATSPMRLR
jgi:CRP-like cAMP-binding protein